MKTFYGISWGLIFLAGCSGSTPTKEAESVSGSSGPIVAVGKTTPLSQDVADLVTAASTAETESRFAEAASMRREIRQQLAAQYGPVHWLVANCDLAIAADDRLAKLSPDELALVAELRELEQQSVRLTQSGTTRRALACINKARPIAARVFGTDAVLPLRLQIMAGQMSQQLGQWELAKQEFEQAAAQAQKMFSMPHPDLENALYQCGLVERQLGALDRSIDLLIKAQKMSEQLGGRDATFAARTHELAVTLHRAGKQDDALRELAVAERIRRTELGDQHPLVAESLVNQAVVLMDQKKWPAAREKLLAAETICAASSSAEKLRQDVRLHLATIGVVQQDFAEAARQLQTALKAIEAQSGRWSPQYAHVAYRLAMSLSFQSDFQQAEPLFRHALSVQRNLLGPSHDQTHKTLQALAKLLERTERVAEAKSLLLEFAYTVSEGSGEASQ